VAILKLKNPDEVFLNRMFNRLLGILPIETLNANSFNRKV
jgi:hypothetical protein